MLKMKNKLQKTIFWLKKRWLKLLKLLHLINKTQYIVLKKELDLSNPKFNFKFCSFPVSAQNLQYENLDNLTSDHQRLAIFAGFSPDGRLYEADIYYLKKLQKVVDGIVVVFDSPLNPEELDKLKNLVVYAKFERHEEYDFGSYKRGWQFLKDKNLLANTKELVICNNSCYGPIYDFSEIFVKMSAQQVDFWGMVKSCDTAQHLQSYFYVFKHNVFSHPAFDTFLSQVKKEKNFLYIVRHYEEKFTIYLNELGFRFSSLVPEISALKNGNSTNYPLLTILNYKMPLLKVKVLSEKDFCKEDLSELMARLSEINPALGELIQKDPRNVLFRSKK